MYNKEVGITLDEAVQQYKALIHRLASTFHVWGWDFDDNVQNLWMEFIKSYMQYKDTGNQFITYLYHHLKNKIATWTTRKRMFVDELDKTISERDVGKQPVVLSDTIASEDLLFNYPEVWEKLDQMEFGWVSKAWSIGWTFEELSQTLNVSRQWVQVLHQRNIEELRRIYATI